MEMATWEAPTDLQDAKELPSLLECCEQMWREHVLSRLAVPEVNTFCAWFNFPFMSETLNTAPIFCPRF